jgi:Calx-beta domain
VGTADEPWLICPSHNPSGDLDSRWINRRRQQGDKSTGFNREALGSEHADDHRTVQDDQWLGGVKNGDYTTATGIVTFLPGETRRSVSISIVGDRKREANETFTVQLSSPSGASFFDGTATATISNDD